MLFLSRTRSVLDVHTYLCLTRSSRTQSPDSMTPTISPKPVAKPTRESVAAPYWIAAIVSLGAFLRLWGIGSESVWLDEYFSLAHLDAESLRAFWERMSVGDPPSVVAPAYFTLEYGWTRLFGTSTLGLRLFGVSHSVAGIYLVYLIGKELYGQRAGLIAATCLACSLPHIYFAQEIRMHGLAITLSLISMLGFVKGLDSNRKIWWWVNGLANLVMLWTLVFTALLVAVQGLYLLIFHRATARRILSWSVWHAGVAASMGAWLAMHPTPEAFWMGVPTLRDLANTFVVLAGGRVSNVDPSPELPFAFSLDLGLALAFLGCTVFVFVRAWWPGRGDSVSMEDKSRATLLALWLVLPPLALFAVSVLYRPCFIHRYLLFASFPYWIAAGAVLSSLPRPRYRGVALALLLGVFAYQDIARFETSFRPAYATAARAIRQFDAAPLAGDAPYPILILKKRLNAEPFQYAEKFPEERVHVAYGVTDLPEISAELLATHAGLWVLMWRWDAMPEYEAFLESQGWDFTRSTLGGMPRLYLYRIVSAE